jgi:hypothetical protein
MAEIEISVLNHQCLDLRLAEMHTVRSEVVSREILRNNQRATIDLRFPTTNARSKL